MVSGTAALRRRDSAETKGLAVKILLHSKAFPPDVGGIETTSLLLANGLTALGEEVRVATSTSADGSDVGCHCNVFRGPSLRERLALVRWAEIILINGPSLEFVLPAVVLSRPFIWIHGGYQAISVDGLGWHNGGPAPLTPWASMRFHFRHQGFLRGAIAALKLIIRRSALHLAAANVAVSQWVAHRVSAPRSTTILNPFPLSQFKTVPSQNPIQYEFVFVGRLVSEKGVSTLLHAFKLVTERSGRPPKLLIIGDGPERHELEALTNALGIAPMVTFSGRRAGPELVEQIQLGEIAIVPSAWEEAMGGVALELLAAGRKLIVSSRGGMKEFVVDAALTFDNGSVDQLATAMETLLKDKQRGEELLAAARRVVAGYDENAQLLRYQELLRSLCSARKTA